MSRYTAGTRNNGERAGGRRVIRLSRRSYSMPSVSLPSETPEEIDEKAEARSGGRSRKRVPKPLRFFPQLFPVPTMLYSILTMVGGMLLLAALFYEVRAIITPYILALVIIVLLYPFRKEPKLRPLLVAGAIVFVIWFLVTSAVILFPFLLAFILAYMAEPLVAYLSKRWYIQRWISALGLTLVTVALFALAAGYITPVMVAQVGSAFASFERVGDALVAWSREGTLSSFTGLPQEKIDDIMRSHVIPKLRGIDSALIEMAGNAGKVAPDLVTTALNFLMIPFMMFYFIKDYWRIRGSIYSFMPQEYQRLSQRFLRDLDEVVGGYLRGDLITSIFQGIFIGAGLYLIGVPGALLLGVVTGFLSLIPFIGGYIAYALALLAALSTPEVGFSLLWVTILFVVQSVIESTIIAPQVMGRHTDLHPVLVILSLLIFGFFMGIPGMLIAIPVTSLLIRFLTRWRDDRRVLVEQEKVDADLVRNPHHARKGEQVPPAAGVPGPA